MILPSNHTYHDHLKVALQAVTLCARGEFSQHLSCSSTSSSPFSTPPITHHTKTNETDITTNVDLSNEALIISIISKAFPNHKIIGEEGSSSSTLNHDISSPTWIIDPIDGTTNFASGNPLCCISVGFIEYGVSKVGVVMSGYGELVVAVEGEGAYINGERIVKGKEDFENNNVDDKSALNEFSSIGSHDDNFESSFFHPPKSTCKTLKDCNVCVEFGYVRDPEGIDAMTDKVSKIMKSGCRSIRMIGSGVLDLIFVALGRFDAVYCGVAGEGWKPWDYAAASVIVREAGCVISNWGDEEVPNTFNMFGRTCICCRSEAIREELVNILTG